MVAAIERASAKQAERPWRRSDPELNTLADERVAAARRLSAALLDGSYRPQRARVRLALIDKWRDLYELTATDRVVHGAVAAALTERLEPHLPETLYSYRVGRSPIDAVRAFARRVRAQRAAEVDPRRRGLYVLRADVQAYGDTIPVGPRSPIFDELAAMLGEPRDGAAMRLVESLARPEAVRVEDEPFMAWRGIATGSPIGTVLNTSYLLPLDRALGVEPELFYARYGDDLLVAHVDPHVLDRAARRTEAELSERGLRLSAHKVRRLYLNAAARPGADGTKGTESVTYLGMAVSARGVVALPREKARRAARRLEERLTRSRALLGSLAESQRATVLAGVAVDAFDPGCVGAIPEAEALRCLVTDRVQLARLDEQRWGLLAEAITGLPAPRALRAWPPRRQRQELGVGSLVAARNDYGKTYGS